MKIKVLINIFLISLMIIFSSTFVYASYEDDMRRQAEAKKDTDIKLEDAIKGADDFLQSGEEKIGEEKIQKASSSLVNLFIAAGTVIAVVYIGILGIKYMAGSVEEKAEIKETLIPFIVGCVVVFGAFTIWKIAILIGSSLSV